MNELAYEMLYESLERNTGLELVAELEKRGIRIYRYYLYHWAFGIYDFEVSEQIIELYGDTVYKENINSIGIGYIYSEEHGNRYYIVFAGI